MKRIASTCLVAAIAVAPSGPALADSGLVGGIVGGIIGGVIVNEANKNRRYRSTQRRSTSSTRSTSGVTSATRNSNREVQTALNYFNFPVGTPDGALGPRSRGAISEYQAMLGFTPTGQLNDFERDLLVQSYYRAQSGGFNTTQAAANNPRGIKGLLLTYRDERLGVTQPGQQIAGAPTPQQLGVTAQVAPVAAAPAAAPVATLPQFGAAAPAAAAGAAVGAAAALPSFLGQSATQVSLASHCNKVSLVTNTNGGFTTQLTMTDPAFALSEQFCLARTYAIAQGEELTSKITGFTPAQISQQCAGFGPVLKDHVASLSVKSREEVTQGVQGFVLQSGMAPQQLSGTAKICLGVGYVTDDMDVAIGSALILSALGETPYSELMGHHLVSGIGTAQRADLALPWFDMGHEAENQGVTPVFAPGMSDRAGLIRLAAYSVAGRPLPGGNVPLATSPAAAPAATLPGFKLPAFLTPKASANP